MGSSPDTLTRFATLAPAGPTGDNRRLRDRRRHYITRCVPSHHQSMHAHPSSESRKLAKTSRLRSIGVQSLGCDDSEEVGVWWTVTWMVAACSDLCSTRQTRNRVRFQCSVSGDCSDSRYHCPREERRARRGIECPCDIHDTLA